MDGILGRTWDDVLLLFFILARVPFSGVLPVPSRKVLDPFWNLERDEKSGRPFVPAISNEQRLPFSTANHPVLLSLDKLVDDKIFQLRCPKILEKTCCSNIPHGKVPEIKREILLRRC
mmetsp:Transcript_9508/g.12325  ORF Transcript_9508/g.12325 Transcript_9508/m.12325 type:complete len:118 (+) Transcript_9508:399-752(+)